MHKTLVFFLLKLLEDRWDPDTFDSLFTFQIHPLSTQPMQIYKQYKQRPQRVISPFSKYADAENL